MSELRKLIISFWVLLNGCQSTVNSPSSLVSGTSIIDNSILNGKPLGFSFSLGDTVRFPNVSDIQPDITMFIVYDPTGPNGGIAFASPSLTRRTFELIAEFKSVDSARSYFQGLPNIPDTSRLSPIVLVHEGQIWTVKSHGNGFAKLLIGRVIAYVEPAHLDQGVAVTFEWVYQPDGTLEF